MSFQFCLAMINLNNFSPFSLIHFYLQNSSMEKTPQNNGKSLYSLGPCTLLHMSPKLLSGRASDTDVLCLENPTLYLLIKISSASAPSETLHFPLKKPSPFSLCL